MPPMDGPEFDAYIAQLNLQDKPKAESTMAKLRKTPTVLDGIDMNKTPSYLQDPGSDNE